MFTIALVSVLKRKIKPRKKFKPYYTYIAQLYILGTYIRLNEYFTYYCVYVNHDNVSILIDASTVYIMCGIVYRIFRIIK